MYFHPNTTKIRITATFRNTMKPLKIELPSVPRIRKILISTTISAAGIFTIPPSQGQAASAWGKDNWWYNEATIHYSLLPQAKCDMLFPHH